jgi:hypothetical protein
MRSFARELQEKEFGYMPKSVSRYITGYLTFRKKVRYQVKIKGIYGGTFLTFEEADECRKKMLKDLG